MSDFDEKFMTHLVETFQEEAREHIETLGSLLIELEKENDQLKKYELIEQAFRESHSLKGASRSVSKEYIELICKEIETVFSLLKKEGIVLEQPFFKVLHETLELLENLIEYDEKDYVSDVKKQLNDIKLLYANMQKTSIKERGLKADAADVVKQDEILDKQEVGQSIVFKDRDKAKTAKTVKSTEKTKVSVDKLINIIRYMEEFLFVKLAFERQIEQARTNSSIFTRYTKKLFENLEKENTLSKITESEELKESLDSYKQIHHNLEYTLRGLKNDERTISRMIDNLLTEGKKLLMFPFSSLMDSFPKIVYDLATEQGKFVDFSYNGAEIEIDRRILDEMRDPFIHLLRNAVDHGIETPKQRVKNGKKERGKIDIFIQTLQNGKVEIKVIDDGAGIDIEKVKQSAVKKGIDIQGDITQLSDDDILKLVFSSGVTTNEMVTDLSGRGIGLAIVEEKALKLGGSVYVKSLERGGTVFGIVLPLLIATYRGILVRVGKDYFIIPASSVSHVTHIEKKSIKLIENREVVTVQDQILPLHYLSNILKIEADDLDNKKIPIIIMESSNSKIALFVDEVVCEQEILMKNLGKQLKRVKNIAASTILTNGEVAFILNVSDLFLSLRDTKNVNLKEVSHKEPDKIKTILVVEDSMTTRTLLKNILQMSGYSVITAVDGVDATLKLMENHIDLVVSDINMPNMDGFELTSKVRSDKQFEELPIILVTALDSLEDKQKGLEVGANAYLIKSDFDQNNLLETIEWMI